MSPKEIQTTFIKSYLKPTLKNEGFLTSGNLWWKNKGAFLLVIHLQNSQWNEKEQLSFCFNIGIALKEALNDRSKKKATHDDIITQLREDAYLADRSTQNKHRKGWLGYLIDDKTELQDFIETLRIDLEEHILPKLRPLNSLDDCLSFYSKFPVWGQILKNRIDNLKST